MRSTTSSTSAQAKWAQSVACDMVPRAKRRLALHTRHIINTAQPQPAVICSPPPPRQQGKQQLRRGSRPAKTPWQLKAKPMEILPKGHPSIHSQSQPGHLHHQCARHIMRPIQHPTHATMTHRTPPLHKTTSQNVDGIIRLLDAEQIGEDVELKQPTAAMGTGPSRRHRSKAGTNQKVDHGRTKPIAKHARTNISDQAPPTST